MVVADGHDFFAGEAAESCPFLQGCAFGANRVEDINHSEVAVFVHGDGQGELLRERRAAQGALGVAHRPDLPGKHHLNGVFG